MRTERFRFKPFTGFRMKRNEACDGSLVHSGAYGEGFVMSRICDTIQMIAEQSRQPTPGDRLLAAVRHWPGVAALWAAADQLWANSSLRPSEYSAPVLGLIFLRFADNAFTKVEAELKGKATDRRAVGKLD